MSEPAEISVVVPTRGRPEALRRCMAALERQTAAVEVIVARDDDSEGPAATRNRGARDARGSVILFTDDDCEPEPGWAATLAAACPPGGAAAGETVNAVPDDRYAAASQLLTSGLQRATLRADGTLGFAPTSNLAVSRELFDRVPFDESYPAAAGEDRDWCARVRAAGAALRYEPRAVVHHHQQLGFRGLWRQQFRYGRGAAAYHASGGELAKQATRRRLLGAAFRASPRTGTLALLAQVAVGLGVAMEELGRWQGPYALRQRCRRSRRGSD